MTLRWPLLVATLMLSLVPAPGHAVEPDEVLSDPVLEARARSISEELRCLVCQNQSIDDSHAALARDLRLLVRERLKAGDSDEGVRHYLVSRYGDFVLLKPPVKAETLLLWGLPFLVLGGGAIGLYAARSQRGPAQATTPLTAEEENELSRLLGRDPDSTS